jgi:hypothetical protein
VATLATSWFTNLCLCSCCVLRISVFDVAPANLPGFDPLSPGGGGCVFKMCWCGIGGEDDNEKKLEALRTKLLASLQNGICGNQRDRYDQDES